MIGVWVREMDDMLGRRRSEVTSASVSPSGCRYWIPCQTPGCPYSDGYPARRLAVRTQMDTLPDAWLSVLRWIPCQTPGCPYSDGYPARRLAVRTQMDTLPDAWLSVLRWIPCQTPGVVVSVLGLVGSASVYCGWVG